MLGAHPLMHLFCAGRVWGAYSCSATSSGSSTALGTGGESSDVIPWGSKGSLAMRAWILSLLKAAYRSLKLQEVIAVRLLSWTGLKRILAPFEKTKNQHFSFSLHDAA